MTAAWQAGKTYVPGSLVVPTAGAAPVQVQPANAGFESGDLTGWTTSDPSRWVVGTNKYEGVYGCRVSGNGLTEMQNDTHAQILPGQSVSVSIKVSITNAGTDDAHFQVVLQWLDASGTLLPGAFVAGNEIQGKGGFWTTSSASGVAPPNAKFFNISLSANAGSHGSVIDVDLATYNYAFSTPNPGIVYKATQAAPGKSGTTEPAWPGVVNVPVTDNQVTWEGELATRIVWQASPLSKSGDTEPNWPLATGANVHDGSINYTAQTLQITDPNCPQSKYVVIAASKVYAADTDIIRYCATVNPLDWTTANDAGYLAYGLQDYGSNPCEAMGLYRSNVVAFNAEGFQMWQVDPDPANIALLDALPVATQHHHALAPTGNDLLFLASEGFRSMGISSAGVNLESGDIGMPIDDMVQAALEAAEAAGIEPISTFIPSMGQFWGAFPKWPTAGNTRVFVLAINVPNAPGKWSYYDFPLEISEFTQLGKKLYIRGGDDFIIYDKAALADYFGRSEEAGGAVDFSGVVQWPYLDLGSPGIDKMFVGFDVVGTGSPSIQMGYNQNDFSQLTDAFVVPDDTVPGMIIPLPIMAPSFSLKLTYPPGAPWQLQAANLYTIQQRITA